MDNREIVGSFLSRATRHFLFDNFHTRSPVHESSYTTDGRQFFPANKHPALGHTPLHSVQVTSDSLYISIPPRAFLVYQETHINNYNISTISSAVSKFKSSAISRRGDWYIVTDVSLHCSASIFRVQAFKKRRQSSHKQSDFTE